MLTGSVVCLSFNAFETFAVASVAGIRDDRALSKGEFQLKFQEEWVAVEEYTNNKSLTMVESMAFFEVIMPYTNHIQFWSIDL